MRRPFLLQAAFVWVAALALWQVCAPHVSAAEPYYCGPISPEGHRLEAVLDGMNVESLWLAHEHINWETGEPDEDADYAGPGRSTHCSAFAAAVGKKLGVYLLRPPEHGQILLANAQAEWFSRPPGARRRVGAKCALLTRRSRWRIKETWLWWFMKAPIRTSPVTSRLCVRRTAWSVCWTKVGFQVHVGAWPDGVRYYAHAIQR